MSQLVILGLGSNRSYEKSDMDGEFDSITILKNAVKRLEKLFLPASTVYSSVYKSKAMYYENQQDFYNMVFMGQYEGQPLKLLEQINAIEAEFGRDRSREFRNGPRSLDIDIEIFGNEVIKKEKLEIPHARLSERQFVLKPLLEIFPECAEPINGTSYREILEKLPDQGVELYCKLPD
ncbi:MAG: 2-amino-4-hydroxy-6-hydroxymethyldihydropteridine diphosphokinase [Treponemataceae bacterium]|nr:2-amino-4-hydroxy-6-hydroxymethyldihydropteridine diphosphokinase [Treponemataceae bacterium]